MFYDFSSVLKEYDFRPFTMTERLLTQPRVILFYISLLFYPLTSRLTLIHDVEISKSLIDPWTTLAAIIIIIADFINICDQGQKMASCFLIVYYSFF